MIAVQLWCSYGAVTVQSRRSYAADMTLHVLPTGALLLSPATAALPADTEPCITTLAQLTVNPVQLVHNLPIRNRHVEHVSKRVGYATSVGAT
jgi:hypothetical protein